MKQNTLKYLIKNRFPCLAKKLLTIKHSLVPVKKYSRQISSFFNNTNLQKKHLSKQKAENLILSCTTFPKRIGYFEYTLFSIIQQTIQPEKIILWLTTEEFPETIQYNTILDSLKKFFPFNFEIRFAEKNYRSFNKLIYALKEFPNHVIVTFDDDVCYKPNWLELLYTSHQKYPGDIIAHRVHRINFMNRHINKYSNWAWAKGKEKASFLNFSTGVGGVLYPPFSLFKDVCDQNLFLRLCPDNDDIWFYVMALLQNRKSRKIKNGYAELFDFDYILDDAYKGISKLSITNVDNNRNDIQLKTVLEHYGIFDSFYEIYGQDQ